ncbi:MAG: hypothetical protein ACLFR1_01405 [Spirochaetia bacterium]
MKQLENLGIELARAGRMADFLSDYEVEEFQNAVAAVLHKRQEEEDLPPGFTGFAHISP